MQLNTTASYPTPATTTLRNDPQQLDVLTYIAAGFVGGVGATVLANEIAGRASKCLRRAFSTSVSTVKSLLYSGGKDQEREEDPWAGKPLTRAQVTANFPEGTWQRQAYDDYAQVLLDEDRVFPCIYATKGFKTDDQLYIFIDSDDLSDRRHIRSLAEALSVYLPQSRALGPNTSLVLLAKENDRPRSVQEYNASFWKLLDGLAELDEKPWPASVPQDIDTDRWCFCYGGEPFFSVIQTPGHQNRLSRYSKGLTIVFQPKWIFDVLFSSDAKRTGAIAKVRTLLAKYDPVPVSPELKNYGDPGSRESKQYFLLDENVPASCPYPRLGLGRKDSRT